MFLEHIFSKLPAANSSSCSLTTTGTEEPDVEGVGNRAEGVGSRADGVGSRAEGVGRRGEALIGTVVGMRAAGLLDRLPPGGAGLSLFQTNVLEGDTERRPCNIKVCVKDCKLNKTKSRYL